MTRSLVKEMHEMNTLITFLLCFRRLHQKEKTNKQKIPVPLFCDKIFELCLEKQTHPGTCIGRQYLNILFQYHEEK